MRRKWERKIKGGDGERVGGRKGEREEGREGGKENSSSEPEYLVSETHSEEQNDELGAPLCLSEFQLVLP